MKNTKSIIILIILILQITALQGFCLNSTPDKILGIWATKGGKAKIQIYKQQDQYFGKIIWAQDQYEEDRKSLKKDFKNEDPSKRQLTIKNLVILNNFIFKEGMWSGGTIYDPENGKTYSCKMELNGSNLEIRGFIGISLFGRTELWQRIKS